MYISQEVIYNMNINERIAQIREHFNLSQKNFGIIIGFKQGHISRIESGESKPTETTINAIVARFPINAEWLRTGEGEMLISPESYLQNGMKFLGKEKMAAGIVNLLSSPEFGDVKALAGMKMMFNSSLPKEIAKYLRYIVDTWSRGDEKTRHWLEKQLEVAFRDAGKEE
jgi:transcriptional regulator with XRE-family HTH domain